MVRPLQTLTDARVKIYNPAALDEIKDIKQAVVEKTGVLTSRSIDRLQCLTVLMTIIVLKMF